MNLTFETGKVKRPSSQANLLRSKGVPALGTIFKDGNPITFYVPLGNTEKPTMLCMIDTLANTVIYYAQMETINEI